jgi:hypothetical protein
MKEFQSRPLDKFRKRKTLSLFGFIVINGIDNDFVWTGKWFKFVKITEQKYEERYLYFDDGWSYQHFWSKWKPSWKFIKLNK